ncbi:uncharacterized protein LY89DRAFT_686673 [Mollisia scopiformis]|uniref:DAPG hydrolase PhiG domain-containing protein n=1 Tax=Mollisia scopiformis TaxID=149040 RepID=A0A194X2C1_MOLSC|nr:uncharacterized protein LY89DRAFT_686673 [Mollisia scopiformis]KUJ14149.1 hypothetical protein LY89DRAFT_686673 [Mollisia scopiformis]
MAAESSPFPLLVSEAKLLLTNPYPPTETGYAVNSEGMHHIAATTYMPNCTSEMIAWWFGWIEDTEKYKLWHPLDHVFSSREGPSNNDSMYIDSHHLVHEYIGGHLAKLKISFVSPEKYFGTEWEEDFKKEGYELAVCARVGNWDDETNEVIYNGHLIHLIKKEKLGVRMRSRFWLGDVEGVEDAQVRMELVPDFLPKGLCQHATEEMTILAGVLPGLYEKFSKKSGDKGELKL